MTLLDAAAASASRRKTFYSLRGDPAVVVRAIMKGEAMLRNFFLSLGDLREPAVRRVLLISALIALAVVGVIAIIAILAIWSLSAVGIAAADFAIHLFGGAVILILAWLATPIAVIATAGLFSEQVMRAVELKSFPDLPPPQQTPFWREISAVLKLFGLMLGLNFLALPLYLIPGVILVLPLALNGFLIGRDWFHQAAMRRLDDATITAARRKHRLELWGSGVLLAVIASTPILNLVTPAIAPAFMLRQFETLRRSGRL